MSKLFDIFQEGTERIAARRSNEQTLEIFQRRRPDDSGTVYWLYGFKQEVLAGHTHIVFERWDLVSRLLELGYDPEEDAWYWYHPVGCQCDQCHQERS